MTGIRIANQHFGKDDVPAKRYQTNKQVPERYSIIQVGICLFHPNPEYHHQDNMAAEYLVVCGVNYTVYA